MRLVSCDTCGVVLDEEKALLPEEDYWNEDGSVSDKNVEWVDSDMYATILCPVCESTVRTSFKVR